MQSSPLLWQTVALQKSAVGILQTIPVYVQVISQEEAEGLQQQGQLLLSEMACGHMYGVTKAAVQAVQYQDKVGLS